MRDNGVKIDKQFTWEFYEDFRALDDSELAKSPKVGLYLWLFGDDKSRTIIYAGQSRKNLYRRQIAHATNQMSGLYLVYQHRCDLQELYTKFLDKSTPLSVQGQTSSFSKFIENMAGESNGEIFFPRKFKGIGDVLDNFGQSNSGGGSFDFKKSLMNTSLIVGTLSDKNENQAEDLDTLETELILRIRAGYIEKYKEATGAYPNVLDQPINLRELQDNKYLRGWIAHTSKTWKHDGPKLCLDSLYDLQKRLTDNGAEIDIMGHSLDACEKAV